LLVVLFLFELPENNTESQIAGLFDLEAGSRKGPVALWIRLAPEW